MDYLSKIDKVNTATLLTSHEKKKRIKTKDYILHISAIHKGSVLVKLDTGFKQVVHGGNFFFIKGHDVKEYDLHFSENEETWETYIDLYAKNPPRELIERIENLPLVLPISTKSMRLLETLINPNPNSVGKIQPIENVTMIAKYISLSIFSVILSETQKSSKLNTKENRIIDAAISHINEHYDHKLNLETLASECGVSKQHLGRIFKINGYPPPMEYLWNTRTLYAMEDLIKTDLSIKEIAKKTGFKTKEHLHKKVYETTGLTPMQYRKKSRL